MIGMFVSTIPMRASVQGSLTFLDFVKQVMADQMKILRHQKYPYNVLMNDLRERDGFTGRLFDISLEYQVMQWQRKENLSFITEPIFSGSGMNDISIHVKDRWDTDTLTIDLDYRTDLFSEDDMSMLFDRLIILLEEAVSQPDRTDWGSLYCQQMNKSSCFNYLREKHLICQERNQFTTYLMR